MGHLANLVLVNEDGYELYYCHWCANVLELDLFWGPEYAISYVERQQSVSKSDGGWINEIGADGGVIIDTFRKVLLFYGGEDIETNIPLRRLYLALLNKIWAGWTIRWAYEGIIDMVDYVGEPRSLVEIERNSTKTWTPNLAQPNEWNETDIIGSFRFEDGSLHLYSLPYGTIYHYIGQGDLLTSIAQESLGLQQLDLREPTIEFPMGGFHVDISSKNLVIWAGDATEVRLESIRGKWTGWTVDWFEDRFEEHLRLTEGKLTFPTIDNDELLTRLEKILLQPVSSAVEWFVSIVKDIKASDDEVITLNPNAFHESPQNVTQQIRKQIFEDAVKAWREDQSK